MKSREDDPVAILSHGLHRMTEADPASIQPDVRFRDQLDVDSMDLLNLVIALHKEFGVEIPKRDYPKLATPSACVAYLESALRSRRR